MNAPGNPQTPLLDNDVKTETSEIEDGEVVIRGLVQRITYYNPENGYSVLQVSIPEQVEQITVVGNGAETPAGTPVIVRGQYVEHPKFGRQLKASAITPTTPSTPAGIEKYLGSGLIKGIGPKTAARIVEKFGDKTLEIIHRHPAKLARISGIGKHKAELIQEAFSEQEEAREVMRFLLEHNVSPGLAHRIYKKYEQQSVEVVKRDPYLLAREMQGIGFATADSIALNIGLEIGSPQRLKAGIYFALEKGRDEGHCYLPEEVLCKRAATLLGVEDEAKLTGYIDELIEEEFVVRDNDGIFLKRLYDAEEFVARFVAERCNPKASESIDTAEVDRCLTQASKELGIEFSHEQRQAVHYASQFPLLLITGGPGCGKTTVIRALVKTFLNANRTLAMAAPTGRAAQRMAQVCGVPAKTIHRLLRYDPMSRGFLYGVNQPLEIDDKPVDVVIIDEASMVDLLLAKDLFSAIPADATIILVGDKDQLPSVGPGRVFADLISKRDVKTVALSQLFRRAEESTINSVAHMINAGIPPEIPEPDGVTKADAYYIKRNDAESAASTIESVVADQIPRKFGINPTDIVVLTPSNRGPLGTIALNERLQNRINPREDLGADDYLPLQHQEFRLGDRVCQRVNNYNLDIHGVFNGDSGTIYSIDRKNQELVVELWDGRLIQYKPEVLGQLSLAYASTVHRSQGSEIPCVVLALHESHFTLLERQLIYTGVTRAKQLLIVVGSRKALAIASKRQSGNQRCTMLGDRISSFL